MNSLLTAPIPSEGRLLLRTRRNQEREQMAANVIRTIRAVAAGTIEVVNAKASAGGDKRRMRGLPVMARGVSGTAPGTQPEQAVTGRA